VRQSYVVRREDLSVVRGRVHAARQWTRLASRSDVVACQFDELSIDNIWNQMLKLGLRTVRPWITSIHLQARWSELMSVFECVSNIEPYRTMWRRLVFDRHAERYRDAIVWVRRLVELLVPSLRGGLDDAPSLLFDMNVLFESVVARVVKRRMSRRDGIEASVQERGTHLTRTAGPGSRRMIELRPDLVVRESKRVRTIIDAKWKRVDTTRDGMPSRSNADMYQLLAYATAFGCDEVVLTCPWHGGLGANPSANFEFNTRRSGSPIARVCFLNVFSDRLDLVGGDPPFLSRSEIE